MRAVVYFHSAVSYNAHPNDAGVFSPYLTRIGG